MNFENIDEINEEDFMCPICQGFCTEDETDDMFITLEDGLYYGEVENLMGSISRDKLVKVLDGNFETFVNGVCPECSKENTPCDSVK